MEILDAIKNRRSVRKFTNQKIEQKTLEKILDVMNYSPNAGNRNLTRIVVITNREMVDYIGKVHVQILKKFKNLGFNLGYLYTR